MKRFLTIVGLLVGLVVTGMVGIHWFTGLPWIESLYDAVILLTTVGCREPFPLTSSGMIFVMVYLIIGLGVFTYGLSQLGRWMVEVRLQTILERRRMEREKEIAKLRDHYVVCGNGRMGEVICEYLAHRDKPFVVIDVEESRLVPTCPERGWLYLHGDATDDEILKRAGVERARALASVLPTDADNVYVVLASRMLNPKLQIVARASDDRAVEKMQRAGASRVISPISSGAVKIARFMLTPSVADFLEIADSRGPELELADVQIKPSSPYVGKQLAETDLRKRGIMVIGIRRADGERLLPPPGTARIQAGDCLVVFGSTAAINEMITASEQEQ